MAHKGDNWFKIRGKMTYPRFFLKAAFEDSATMTGIWDKEIVKDLPGGSASWTASLGPYPTNLSRYAITYSTTRRYLVGLLTFEIGIYRDGFHISMKTSGHGAMSNKDQFDLSEAIFGDPNRTSLWTQEIAKVAPMTNELLKKIEEHY